MNQIPVSLKIYCVIPGKSFIVSVSKVFHGVLLSGVVRLNYSDAVVGIPLSTFRHPKVSSHTPQMFPSPWRYQGKPMSLIELCLKLCEINTS